MTPEPRAGQSVLVLGATDVAAKLAVQAAKLLKAGRVVAAGATLRRWRRCPTLAWIH